MMGSEDNFFIKDDFLHQILDLRVMFAISLYP